MDLAMALAAAHDADLVVANDPDADRCAAAVPPAPRKRAGGCCAATRWARCSRTTCWRAAAPAPTRPRSCPRACSGEMAAAAGQPYVETLTGFKWIGRVEGLVFGYEEALGYCCDPEHVKDKDGVSALLLLCELAAQTKAEGRTLVDVLDDLAMEHGLHATDQVSVRVADLSLIAAAMERLRAAPPGRSAVWRSSGSTTSSLGSADLPPTDGLRFQLADGARVVVRPSGTEPKLKCYLEVVVPVDAEAGVDAARISAAARLDALGADAAAALGL